MAGNERMPMFEIESAPRIVPVFSFIDLDRTFFKTTAYTRDYLHPQLVEQYQGRDQMVAATIIKKLSAIEASLRGQSYDFMQAFSAEAKSRGLQEPDAIRVTTELLNAHRTEQGRLSDEFIESVLDTDVFALDAVLDEEGGEWGIITKGSLESQGMKLAIVRAIFDEKLDHAPGALIVQADKKATQIAQWYELNTMSPHHGMFIPPSAFTNDEVIVSERARIIDDKPENLVVGSEIEAAAKIEGLLARPLEEMGDGAGRSLAAIAEYIRGSKVL